MKANELQGVSLYDEMDWLKMNNFLIFNLPKFENSLQPFITKLK
jgi:hypothetical protein